MWLQAVTKASRPLRLTLDVHDAVTGERHTAQVTASPQDGSVLKDGSAGAGVQMSCTASQRARCQGAGVLATSSASSRHADAAQGTSSLHGTGESMASSTRRQAAEGQVKISLKAQRLYCTTTRPAKRAAYVTDRGKAVSHMHAE